jgi:hypothetical protein
MHHNVYTGKWPIEKQFPLTNAYETALPPTPKSEVVL